MDKPNVKKKLCAMALYERRRQLIYILYERRFDTVANLASEFCVCKHTIARDVQVLSLEYPIFTKSGRCGGVYIPDGSYLEQRQLTIYQRDFLLEIGKRLPEEDLSFAYSKITFSSSVNNLRIVE